MRLPLLVTALLLTGTSSAFAHRLHVDPKIVGDQLRVEAYYDDDTPAQDARITVRAGDVTVAEGRTDDKGVWTCPKPTGGKYTVRAESVGHAATETLDIGDFAAAAEPPATDEPKSAQRLANTRTPWRNLAVGLGLLGTVCVAWLFTRKAANPARSNG
jgi:nickel transport protein